MFCSHCGKTVDPAAEKCAHCGAPLGDSKLSGHTAVQVRVVPAGQEGEQPARYTPYTKTSYTGEMSPGEDVYSRTAYRPVLAEQPAAQEDASAQEGQPAQGDVPNQAQAQAGPQDAQKEAEQVDVDALLGDKPIQLDEAQKAALKKLEQVPENAPAPDQAQQILREETGIQVKPLTPIRKKGISPEVENYIQRMEAMKDKKAAKKRDRRAEEYEEEDLPEEAVSQDAPVYSSGQVQQPQQSSSPRTRARGRIRHWVGRAAALLLIVAVIGGGLFYLAYITQPRSPIDGVSSDLFDQGVALMKERISDNYRREIVSLYQSDTAATSVVERQAADAQSIRDLMPENPMENDQVFIDTLLSIQEAIDAATATDALAVLTQSSSSVDLTADSEQNWAVILNYVTRLENATSLSELNIVSGGVQEVMATPSPSPTPAVETYNTLSKGSKGQKVKDLQERLRDLGWLQGMVDGIYGSATRKAVQLLQEALGLPQNGVADPELQALLYSDQAPVKGAAAPSPTPDASAAANTGQAASGETAADGAQGNVTGGANAAGGANAGANAALAHH